MGKAALLDVDGTLVDANYHHALAWYRAFRQHEITLPIWRIHRAVGMGGDQLVPSLIGPDVDEEKGEDIRSTRDKLFAGMIDEVAPFEGAHELVVELLERDIAVVLASSSPEDDIEHYLELLDLRTLVDDWTTKDDVDQTKPEPDLVKAALEKLDHRQAIMVGDTKWDVDAASEAGIETVGVTSGGWWRDELRDAGAVAVFETIVDLRERLDETPFAA